jgi:hypothetical protein
MSATSSRIATLQPRLSRVHPHQGQRTRAFGARATATSIRGAGLPSTHLIACSLAWTCTLPSSAHTARLSLATPQSTSEASQPMLSTGPSSLSADPKHTAIASSSGASSMMWAHTWALAPSLEFELLGTHPVDGTRSFFASVRACRSRTSRPWRWWTYYCISVSGASLQTLRVEIDP